jgi:arylsulfatase A-like enzyme
MPGFRDVPRHVRDVIHRHYRAYRSATRVDFEAGRSPGATDTTVEQQRHMQALQDLMPEYRELYDAAVRLADERLGSVVRWLRKRGSWENTIFIFLSDHGEEFFEHDGFTHGQCVYEQVARVPLIVRFPGGRYAGRRIRDVVSLVDVLPTLLAALDEPRVAVRARGRNLLALIDARGVSGGLTPENVTSSEPFFVPCVRRNVMNHYGPAWLRRGDINVVVRSGRFKGIWNAEPGTLELYDLGLDAHEQCDLAGERPDLAAQMRDFARAWLDARSSAGDDSAGTIEQLDERTLRTLRALGYAD